MSIAKKARKRAIENDDDVPVQGAGFFKRAGRAAELMPDLVEHEKARRGRPKLENAKVAVSFRVDPTLLQSFKATGRGWQGLVHQALEEFEHKHLVKKSKLSLRSKVVRDSTDGQFIVRRARTTGEKHRKRS